MLKRKFTTEIENFLKKESDKILLVNGARQIGKSYLIRYVGTRLFPNLLEINLKEDKEGRRYFANVRTTDDLYMQLSFIANGKLGTKADTLVFLDEIQSYPHLLTMLKFLNQEGRFRYIASGSQLGIALAETPSVPIGTIITKQMYPLDFEEFMWAMGTGEEALDMLRQKFKNRESLDEQMHLNMLKRFQYYLLVGGLPEAVNTFISDRHIQNVRVVQHEILELYKIDASQYDSERKLKIRAIYDMIPSTLENKRKRIIYKQIENKNGKQYTDYADEFEYLTASGIALKVQAVSNPKFPLVESEQKNLLKLYLNDIGILTSLLYGVNVNAILQDYKSINLGTVYESVVAQELCAHGFSLFYFDNKQRGEVDFLIDDYKNLKALPIEVKSGKDYTVHSALSNLLKINDYDINNAIVFSNERVVSTKNGITYMPIYYSMFLQCGILDPNDETVLPELPPIM